MIVSNADLLKFFENVKNDFDIFVPYASELDEDNLSYKKFPDDKNFIINKYRTIDPIKTLFYLPSESVLPPSARAKKRIIVGVKNCDLQALKVLDSALLEDDFEEPNYKIWRENSYIISSDCTDILPTCHCNLLDINPYPIKDSDEDAIFDLNLSPVEDKFLITIGTKKGEELIKLFENYYSTSKASAKDKDKIESQHAEVRKKLTDNNSDYSSNRKYEVISKTQDEKYWKELCEECVECGGCTNICPTCYCIILNDESENNKFKKVRTWDSCQLNGYARVAGGASPREKLWERFRNRYQCKFVIMNQNFSKLGCTGCGRCISVCPAGIDLREVIQNLQEV
ncbi:MAG: 4Fe-4S dicluster domain-containing protein [Candidatus Cloacimonetes bacterium]|nr:4Fe-4S dicluster domain-containing protein [Candidatus Cloacimonadota bacterium]